MTNTRYIGGVSKFSDNDKLAPYIGYKVIAIKTLDKTDKTDADFGDLQICGPHFHDVPYSLSADSTCKKNGNKHNFVDCSCGFYAYKDVPNVLSHWRNECGGNANHAIVQVALSQKVVVAEHGFRASHQRVTKVLMPHCWNCPSAGDYMVPHSAGFYVAGCTACVTAADALADSISFAEFGKRFAPTGFDSLVVASASDLGAQAQDILYPEYLLERARTVISKIVEKGDLFALQNLAKELDADIERLVKTAFSEIV